MTPPRRASVIVNNHNYARWLGEAIDSALHQTHPVEVVVVDDGSTDDSREVMAAYGDRIVAVLQPNRGQAAALNAGFAASRGDPVLFLDADDVLLPTALEGAAARLRDRDVAHVHWYQVVIDECSKPVGERHPATTLPEGDLREQAFVRGPDTVVTSATSGNAFPRWVLDRVMPIPSSGVRYCAELFPITLARLCGPVGLIPKPQSLYRRHPGSGYFATSFDRRLEIGYDVSERLIEAYRQWFGRRGVEADVDAWRENSWHHRLRRVVGELDRLVPSGEPFLLIDHSRTGLLSSDERAVIPFPSRNGVWWGAPSDDDAAIAEVERHREAGVGHLVLVWTAAWYGEQYPRFLAHLRQHYRCIVDEELLIVFDLRTPRRAGQPASL